MKRMHDTVQACWRVFAFLGIVSGAYATELTGNVSLNGGATLTASPDSIVSQADNKTYKWSDKDGDDTGNPAAANLDMKTYNITRSTDATGFTLDLHDGTAPGSITWDGPGGGSLSTYRSANDVPSGPITITNAVNISLKELDARGRNNANGGAIRVNQSGNLTVTGSIMSNPTQTGSQYAQLINLIGGGADTGTPAGTLQVGGSLDTRARNPRAIHIRGYESVDITGSLRASVGGSSAESSCDHSIRILNIGAGGIEIGGAIETHGRSGNDYYSSQSHVELQTAGAVQIAGAITTWTGNDQIQYQAGNITITATNDIGIAGAMDTAAERPKPEATPETRAISH